MKIHWTDTALAWRTPRNTHALTPLEPAAPLVLQPAVSKIVLGGGETGDAVEAMAKGWSALQALAAGEPYVRRPEVDGILLALIASLGRRSVEGFLEEIVQAAGVEAAVDTVVASLPWRLTDKNRLLRIEQVQTGYSLVVPDQALVNRQSLRLRRQLFRADLEGKYSAVIEKLDICEAAVLCWYFPEHPLCKSVGKKLVAAPSVNYYSRHLPSPSTHFPHMVSCAVDLGTAEACVGRYSGDATTVVADVLDRFGESAWPAVQGAFRYLSSYNWGSERYNNLFSLLDMLEGIEDFSVLVPLVPSPKGAKILELFQKDPQRGVATLAERLHFTGEERKNVTRVLDLLLDAHPELEAGAGLPTESRRALEGWVRFRKTGFAEGAEIPALLQNPPWKGQKKKGKAVVLTLTELAVAPELRVSLRPIPSPWRENLAEEQKTLETFQQFLDGAQKKGEQNLWTLQRVSSEGQKALIRPEVLDWVALHSNYYVEQMAQIVKGWLHAEPEKTLPILLKLLPMLERDELGLIADVGHPHFVPKVINIYNRRRRERRQALAWMQKFPRIVAVVLIPQVMGKGNAREAERALRALWGKAETEIRAVAAEYGAEAAVAERIGRDPMELLPASMPDLGTEWGFLPMLRLKNGRYLPEGPYLNALMMIRISTVEDPYVGLELLKEVCDPESLAELVWAWHRRSENWTWAGVAYLGNDTLAQRVGRWLRTGNPAPGELDTALKALLTMGSDAALVELARLAERAAKAKTKEAAKKLLKDLATDRGLTEDELADRLVPDLDLGEENGNILDFGSRQFRVTIDESLRPQILDSAQKPLPKFPAANKTDDKEKVKLASNRWKELQTSLEGLARTQIPRLERGMVEQRTWNFTDFRNYFVEHPVMQHLSRRLVWSTDQQRFRVAEDGSFADVSDDSLVLPEDAVIHLLHPIDASAEERGAWGQVFADYALLQPFPQLGRPVFLRLPEETGVAITRFSKMEVPGKVLLGLMERAGWIRGSLDYGRELYSWHRTLDGHSMSASVSPAINLENLETLHTVTLNAGTPIEGLSPRIFSELVRPLESVRR